VATELSDDIEREIRPLAGKAEIRLERKVLSSAVVTDGQYPKTSTVPKPIVDKVERPAIVWS